MNPIRATPFAFALAVSFLVASAADEDLDVAPAMRAAAEWLAAVDAGRYGESWEQAAPFFREATPKLKWEVAVQTARGPLGNVAVRKLRAATFTRSLPGAPPGEYLVIHYDTQFENRAMSSEIVTPMRQPDGSWKVSGYFIR